jgi:bifunctional enzyme CysN/CysC
MTTTPHDSNTTTIWYEFEVDKAALSRQKNQKPCVFWFVGLSASGKSTLANMTAEALYARGRHIYTLDGDNLRHGLNHGLGFSEADRTENIRRAGEVAHLMVDAGLVVLASFISPYQRDRMAIRARFEQGEFYEIFVDTPIEICMQRDPKGLYAQALAGRLLEFTGISAPFEIPKNPDLHLDGTRNPEQLLTQILDFAIEKCNAQTA